MSDNSSLDCVLSNGVCPLCGFRSAPHVRRNCPVKLKDRPAKRPESGPGTELAAIFQQIAVKNKPGCGCKAIAKEMNRLGVAGCREHREELLAKLKENYDLYGLTDKLIAAFKTVTSGLASKINPLDPLGSLLDEAIRRAESQSASTLSVAQPPGPEPSASP